MARIVEIVEYNGHKFPVFKDSPEQRISPKRQFKKRMRQAEKEFRAMLHGKKKNTA